VGLFGDLVVERLESGVTICFQSEPLYLRCKVSDF